MAEIVLTAISTRDVGERQVFNTGLSTVGRSGNDYLCGHCNHKMLGNFNLARLELDLVFQCGSCGGLNVAEELLGRTAETAIKDEPEEPQN